MTNTVTVVGQGYVGLPLAMAAVEVGHRVIGVDVDERRVARLAAGESFVEDISEQQLRSAIDTGRYRATTSWQDTVGSDIFVITVPTPLREGMPDLSYVESAGREIAGQLVAGATVVLESTTYPGTTDQLLAPILEQGSGLRAGVDFHLGYSPERIDPSNKKWGMRNTPKVVSGIDDASLETIRDFYASFVEEVVPVTSTRTAELTKLLENTFRHVNIALVNEIAAVAPELGVDIWEAIDAADSKPFGFMKFTPGPGVGGHCLPIDPSYLLWQVRQTSRSDLRMVSAANDINDHMPDHVVRRVQAALNRQRLAVNGAKVLLLGMAYKKNVGDIRESPSLSVARQLRELGAEVHAAEPHTDPEFLPSDIELVEFGETALAWADAVVVLTDHDAFDFEVVAEHATYVFDTRNRCVGSNVELL
ncbi:UDP-N-acetyl-D-glucosamine dehydrogenase [Nocardioides sp. Soil797]|nr:UDP-N-acetyl-D-glucosamine dehydrogenase [Nocardioides sp. Soil797]